MFLKVAAKVKQANNERKKNTSYNYHDKRKNINPMQNNIKNKKLFWFNLI